MNIFKGLYKINKNTQCWEWQSTITNNGYAWVRFGKRRWIVSRLSYIINIGEVPQGHDVMHICDNRKCINPKHLKTGTRKENMQDMIDKGRIHCERYSRYYTYNGKSQGLKAWAKEYNINYSTLNNRINRLKWSIKKALEKGIRIYNLKEK